MLSKKVFVENLEKFLINFNFSFKDEEEKKKWLRIVYDFMINKKVDNKTFELGIQKAINEKSRKDFITRPSANEIYYSGIAEVKNLNFILKEREKEIKTELFYIENMNKKRFEKNKEFLEERKENYKNELDLINRQLKGEFLLENKKLISK